MGIYGLAILSIIQIFTAVSMFFSYKQESVLGIITLRGEVSIYRYLLSSLWLSISIIYILGALYSSYYKAAETLGIINICLEIVSYWFGFLKNKKIPKWYPPLGTAVMSIPLILLLSNH